MIFKRLVCVRFVVVCSQHAAIYGPCFAIREFGWRSGCPMADGARDCRTDHTGREPGIVPRLSRALPLGMGRWMAGLLCFPVYAGLGKYPRCFKAATGVRPC